MDDPGRAGSPPPKQIPEPLAFDLGMMAVVIVWPQRVGWLHSKLIRRHRLSPVQLFGGDLSQLGAP